MKKNILLMGFIIACVGCSAPSQKGSIEEKASYVGDWINERAGLIQVGVQATTHIIVYSTVKDSEERTEVLTRLHAISSNLDALVRAEKVDPYEVRQALKAKEPYIDAIISTVANIYASEYETLKKNGYANLAIQILKAVSKGVESGTVQ